MSETVAFIGTIWIGLSTPMQQRADHCAAAQLLQQPLEMLARVQRRHDQHVGGPGEAAEGIEAPSARGRARHRPPSRRHTRNRPRARSSSITHSRTRGALRRGGLPKVEKDRSATRGVKPMRAGHGSAVWMAMSASASRVGQLVDRGVGDEHGAAAGHHHGACRRRGAPCFGSIDPAGRPPARRCSCG